MKKQIKLFCIISSMLCIITMRCIITYAMEEITYGVEKEWINLKGTSGDETLNPTVPESGYKSANVKITIPEGMNSNDLVSITAGYDRYGILNSVRMGKISDAKAEYSVDFPTNGDVKSVRMFLWNMKSEKCVGKSKNYNYTKYVQDINFPISKLQNDGLYTKRATFENDTLEMFTSDLYNHLIPEFVRTNEINANSGKYCLKVSSRTNAVQTLGAYLDGIDCHSDTKVTVSCYLHNVDVNSSRRYSLQTYLPDESGKTWNDISYPVTVTGDKWVKLEGTLDYSKYNFTEEPYVQIIMRDGVSDDFYVDDFLIKADCTGETYDDLVVSSECKDEKISETPNKLSSNYVPIEDDTPVLKDIYSSYFKIGASICDNALNETNRYNLLIKKHCNSAVGENAFKMQNIIKDPKIKTKYDFSPADKMMDFCYKNGIDDIIGHCLVWDISSATPYLKNDDGSLLDREESLSFMKEYITKIMRHFEGDGDPTEYTDGIDYSQWHINAWDVVNEASDAYTSDGYKTSGGSWINAVGNDYVDYAYKYASETEYTMDFRYNDYDEDSSRKCTAIYNIVKSLRDNGRDVDSIGIQSHYNTGTDVQNVREAFNKFASLGVKFDISELDVSAYTGEQKNASVKIYEDGIAKSAEYNQVQLFSDLFELYKEYSDNIDRVNLWTISDRLSAANGSGSGTGFYKTDYAGIFDRNYKSKPQFWVIADKNEFGRRYPEYGLRTNLTWNFEDNKNNDVSTDYSLDVGKWTGYNNLNSNTYRVGTNPIYTPLSEVRFRSDVTNTVGAEESTKCLSMYLPARDATSPSPPQAIGIRVRLSKNQLEVNRTYNLNFWLTGNNEYTNRIYAFFRRPDSPENLENGGGTKSALPWLKDDGSDSVGLSENFWKQYDAQLTPTADVFDESGYTVLWIAVRPKSIKNVADGNYYQLLNDRYLYIDDISLTPQNQYIWNFEDSCNYDVNTNYSVDIGKWSGYNNNENNTHRIAGSPKYTLLSNVKYRDGITEPKAKDGSSQCVSIYLPTAEESASWTPQAMGIRVKLSEKQIEAGKKYSLSFWSTGNNKYANRIYAFFRRPDSPENLENGGGTKSALPWLKDDGSDSVGLSENFWKQYDVQLTPTDDVFDESGYTVLWIVLRPKAIKNIVDGTYYQISRDTYMYFDDVILKENSN